MKCGSHHSGWTKRWLSQRVRKFWTVQEREKASVRTRERIAKRKEQRAQICAGRRLLGVSGNSNGQNA
jgi:hypothetical protein